MTTLSLELDPENGTICGSITIKMLLFLLVVCTTHKFCATAALRGVAIQRGRARAAFPTTHAAAAALNGAFTRLPTPLAAAANAANAIHGYAP